MRISPESLREFVEQFPKLVTRRQSKEYPELFVIKFTKKVFYDAKWDAHPLINECRGLVVDAEYNIVARPFTKIFNYLENGTGADWSDSDYVMITKKINGFMAAVTLYKGELLISTTGSLDSDFVGYAREYLSKIDPLYLQEDRTYMFEICHPSDPHIIPEKAGAYFLARVRHNFGYTEYKFDLENSLIMQHLETVGIITDSDKDLYQRHTFAEVKAMLKECRHEGFVVVNIGLNETIKMKSPWYLGNKAIARKEDILKLNKQFIDEEFYGLIDDIKKMGDIWTTISEQDRLKYITEYFEKVL